MSIGQDIDDRRALRAAGAPVGIKKLVQRLREADDIRDLKRRMAKLEARFKKEFGS